jgi:hypothetical protein
VITLSTLPFWPSGFAGFLYDIDGGGATGLPTSLNGTPVTYTWIGVMEYYIDGYHATASTGSRPTTGNLISSQDGSGADAVLHIIQGSTLLGALKVPDYANIRTASIAKINLFLAFDGVQAIPYYQFVPDVRIVDYYGGLATDGAGIMSVGEEQAGVFGTFGAPR